jgi:hypothetical protein
VSADRTLSETFEILGQLREEITMLESHAADLEDEQLSIAVARMRTWTVAAGNRVAVLRMSEAVAA